MIFDFVIDRSTMGSTIGPGGGGFLTDLTMTQPGSSELAQCRPDGRWTSMYLQLRGTLDFRDIYCAIPSQNFTSWSGKTLFLIADHSLPYKGDLMVVCVPRGAVFEISLSDVELTEKERDARMKAKQREYLEATVAAIQKKADKLAPVEPVPPLRIERPRERVTVRERRR